jgi:cystathionine beta-lyase
VFFDSVAAMRSTEWKDKSGYTYGLHGTPTTYVLEERLCTLEGGLHCLLASSGLAAIALVSLALLRTGDEVLLPDNAYGPGKVLASGQLRAWGITPCLLRPDGSAGSGRPHHAAHPAGLARSAGLGHDGVPRSGPAWWASAAQRGVLCALDNTWGAGIAFRPFDLRPSQPGSAWRRHQRAGPDQVPQRRRRCADGQRDHARCGAACPLQQTHMRLGLGVGVNDVETVLRSLPSIYLALPGPRRRGPGAGAPGARAARSLPRSCTRRFPVRPAMRTGKPTACPGPAAPRACSAVVVDARFSQPRSTPSATA